MDKSFDLWNSCKIGTVIGQDIKQMLEKQKYKISVSYEKTELETKFLFKYLGKVYKRFDSFIFPRNKNC